MKFNEKEVGKLLQRATELHEESVGNSDHNLSLSEIETIATELGVPVQYLQEAALEMREGSSTKNNFSFWGAPFSVDQTKFATGKLTEKEWDQVLLELQRFSGKSGTTGSVGDARHWTYQVGEGDEGFSFEKLKVTMRPAGENQTAIHIRQDYQGAVAMYIMAFGITSFLTLIVAHSLPDVAKLTELLYAGLGGALSLGGVRALVAASTKRYREKLSSLANQLRQIIDKTPNTVRDDELAVRDEEVAPGLVEIPDHDEYGSDAKEHTTDSRSRSDISGDD